VQNAVPETARRDYRMSKPRPLKVTSVGCRSSIVRVKSSRIPASSSSSPNTLIRVTSWAASNSNPPITTTLWCGGEGKRSDRRLRSAIPDRELSRYRAPRTRWSRPGSIGQVGLRGRWIGARNRHSALWPSNFLGLSNTSRYLTDRPAHGDLAESRSDSPPSMRDVRDRAGEDWPEWVSSRWRRSTSPTNFFTFRPLQKSPCLAPARKPDCRTTQRPYRFHRSEATPGCDLLRGSARFRSSSRVVCRVRADDVYLAFALKIWGFCDVAPGSHAPKYSRYQL